MRISSAGINKNKRKSLKRKNNISGIMLLFSSIFLFLACIFYDSSDQSFNVATNLPVRNIFGKFGSYPADILMQSFGFSSYVLILGMIFWAFMLIVDGYIFLIWLKVFALCMMLVISASFIEMFMFYKDFYYEFLPGGYVGYFFINKYVSSKTLISRFFVSLILIPSFILCWYIFFSFEKKSAKRFFAKIWNLIYKTKYVIYPIYFINRFLRDILKYMVKKVHNEGYFKTFFKLLWQLIKLAISKKSREFFKKKQNLDTRVKNVVSQVVEIDSNDEDDIPNFIANVQKINPIPKKISHKVEASVQIHNNLYERPKLELLTIKPQQKAKSSDANVKAKELVDALADFGVSGEMQKVSIGPVVSLFEFKPKAGTKSSRIIGLADDIARTVKKVSTRISVIQGTDAIGIELPNDKRSIIYFRSVLESKEFVETDALLPIALGHDIAGKPVIMDMAKMPHLLIAGTTGSGKSVGINTMILSLLYKLSPSECKMIMIDPKMLELSVYDGIPHLMTPVITDPKKSVLALKWAVAEMENRYKMMSTLGVRNIVNYNARVEAAIKENTSLVRKVDMGYNPELGKTEMKEIEFEKKKLPYIVVIVDEMADLMITAGKEVEAQIQRLAQMARASGIHIIMATQRPSVDVITGVIKANFPSRISFQVTSRIDSRTILGEQGAEQLLGNGDMLFAPSGLKAKRVHGPFVSDSEVHDIVTYLKENNVTEYVDILSKMEEDADSGGFDNELISGGKDSDLYSQAINIVMTDKKTSISYLQRKMRIGYNKAANFIEKMEQDGILSPADSTGKRTIL